MTPSHITFREKAKHHTWNVLGVLHSQPSAYLSSLILLRLLYIVYVCLFIHSIFTEYLLYAGCSKVMMIKT